MPELSIIIVTYNSEKDIRPCLDSVDSTHGDLSIETFVVDNNSRDNTVSVVCSEYPGVQVIANNYNAGFPGANNQAIEKASGDYIMLLNPDTVVQPGAMQSMLAYMEQNPKCGVLGPTLLDPDGSEAKSLHRPTLYVTILDILGLRCLLPKKLTGKALEVLSGACLLFRREVVAAVGMLDEKMHTFEDADFCVRANARGFDVCQAPEARIVHIGGQSNVSNMGFLVEKHMRSRCRYFLKHEPRPLALLILSLIYLNALTRYIKWWVLLRLSRREDASERIQALRKGIAGIRQMIVTRGASDV